MTTPGPAQLPVTLAPFGVPRGATLRRPSIAILLVSLVVAIPLMIFSILDTAGLRTLWENLHWSETAVAAAAAATISIRGSVGRPRAIRFAGTIALSLWMVATLLWANLNVTTQATLPPAANVFIVAILIPGMFIIATSIRGRITWAEQAAVYIDSALIVCLLVTVLIVLRGPAALDVPSAGGMIAFAYPTAFIGLGAGGFVALMAGRYPIAPRGAFVVICGTVVIGLAYLGWFAPNVHGTSPGELPKLLFTLGTLLAAFGVVTWEDERNDDARYVAWTRLISRIVGPTAVAILFLALLLDLAPGIELIANGAVFVGGILFVIRQGLLLRERTTMLAEVTRLKIDNDRLVEELRRELEEHALDQRRMIQASRAAAVGELAAGVAHEVNNPLAAVLGFAELVLDDLDQNDPRRADLETIRNQALRARTIIRALGDFAQGGTPAPASTDLADVIARTVNLVRFQIERRGVTIEERYAEVPELLVDPRSIQQAVINVLTNATQAVGDDGHIVISVGGTDSVVTIVVTDDGVGMTDSTAHRAFEPFFTGDEFQSAESLATGLGLAVARGLIEANGGNLSLTSRPGLGTHVEFRLPVHQPTTVGDRSGLGGENE